jgi:hypothetical protein
MVAERTMTVDEIEKATAKAKTALVAALAHVVDLATLKDGDGEFAYFVDIPADRAHELTQRISDIEYHVNAEYDVWVRVLPVPTAA